jgi:hypothetical protein
MPHGKETQAEERQIGVGKKVAPGVGKPPRKSAQRADNSVR